MKDWDWQRLESLAQGAERSLTAFLEEWSQGSGVQHDARHMVALLAAAEHDVKTAKALLAREKTNRA